MKIFQLQSLEYVLMDLGGRDQSGVEGCQFRMIAEAIDLISPNSLR